jgi:hypothetical protein
MWWTQKRVFYMEVPIFFHLKISRPFINKLRERARRCFINEQHCKLYDSKEVVGVK